MNTGTALAICEESLLVLLARHESMAGVSLLDRKPTKRVELTATTGALEAFWIDGARAALTAHGGRAGRVAYDEEARLDMVIQLLAKNTRRADAMRRLKFRAAEILDAVIDSVAQAADLDVNRDSDDVHSRFEFVLDSYERSHGAIGTAAIGVRYEIAATLHARITPAAS